MKHHHLDHQDFTLAAIDDIIGNGKWEDWVRLRLALRRNPAFKEKILRICDVRVKDPSAQRHRFWRNYAEATSNAP